MKIEPYTNKKGSKLFRPVFQSQDEVDGGFCIGCGTEVSRGVEPDARGYTCDLCGENKVYGMEELVLMNIARIEF